MNAQANLIALGTITRREVTRILRIWAQTLLPPAITMTLYFIIFGSLIGSRIGEIAPGISYIEYIAPGLIMMSVIQNAYGNITSSFFGAKFQRFVEEMLVSPMPSWTILGGYVSGAVLRGLMVGVIVLLISLLFTKIHLYHPLVTLSTFLLAAVIFALLGFVNAIYRAQVRRYRDHPDLHPHPADLSWRRVLQRRATAVAVARAVASESDPVHGQRVSLRPARRHRRRSGLGLRRSCSAS